MYFYAEKTFKKRAVYYFNLLKMLGGELRLIPRKHQQKNIKLKVSVQNGNWNRKTNLIAEQSTPKTFLE